MDGTSFDGDKILFPDDEVVMDSLNSMTVQLGVHNVTLDFKRYPRCQTSDGKSIFVELICSDESVVDLKKSRYYYDSTMDIQLIPLKEGTAVITANLYTTDLEGNIHEGIVDTYSFTVIVKPFESQVTFEEDDFIPAENGYPYLRAEYKAGDDAMVQIWTMTEDVPLGGTEGGILVVTGTGEMWDNETHREKMGHYPEWNTDDCVTRVHIQEGITRIDELDGLDNLTEVSYPSTLKVIGKSCFFNTALTEAVIPEGVERIEERAYYRLPTLTKIELPGTLKYIGGAFDLDPHGEEDSENLVKEVIIPKSVEYIAFAEFGYRWGINIIVEDGTDTSGYEDGWDCIPYLSYED